MPITKSAQKALRSSQRKEAVNKPVYSRLTKALKKTRQKPTATTLSRAFSTLDKAAKKKVIHQRKANRLKSRLSRLSSAKSK